MVLKEIELVHITKKFGDHLVLDDVSFCAEKGDVLGLLGPNGAGKTTTIKILTTFIPPTSGQATISGFNIYENPHKLRENLGYLPDYPPLYHEMTTLDFLKFVADLKNVKPGQRQQRLEYVIEKCGLKDVALRLIYKLSRGYRQRVGIAQAIINNPRVLVLDEPTVGLDPIQIIEIRELIRGLALDHTILLSTHILGEVELLCNKVVIMNKGKVVAKDSLGNLSTHNVHEVKLDVVVESVSSDLVEQIKKIDGVIDLQLKEANNFILTIKSNDKVRQEVAQCIVASGSGLLSYSTLRYRLEDLFLQLTKDS